MKVTRTNLAGGVVIIDGVQILDTPVTFPQATFALNCAISDGTVTVIDEPPPKVKTPKAKAETQEPEPPPNPPPSLLVGTDLIPI